MKLIFINGWPKLRLSTLLSLWWCPFHATSSLQPFVTYASYPSTILFVGFGSTILSVGFCVLKKIIKINVTYHITRFLRFAHVSSQNSNQLNVAVPLVQLSRARCPSSYVSAVPLQIDTYAFGRRVANLPERSQVSGLGTLHISILWALHSSHEHFLTAPDWLFVCRDLGPAPKTSRPPPNSLFVPPLFLCCWHWWWYNPPGCSSGLAWMPRNWPTNWHGQPKWCDFFFRQKWSLELCTICFLLYLR